MGMDIIATKLNKEIILDKNISAVIGLFTFTLLTVVGAFVRVPLPFTPVPITAQTFFIFLAGLFLGKRLASLSQLSYIFLGISGLPVFTTGGGVLCLSGPTGGYLLGFIVCAWVIGRLMELKSNPTFFWVLFSVFTGSLSLYFLGVVHLMLLTGASFSKGIYMGFLPFFPGCILKMILASLIFWKFRYRIRQIFPLT